MDIFMLFTLCGGLAFFLYGMHVMSTGLEKMAGGRLEKVLKSITSNRFKSLLFGAGITIAIQSSSALTVMLVGLVNSGIMQLGQTVGVIMGSNIGTTLTAWILSLAGIESENFFLRLMNPEAFAPILAMVGILLIMATKRGKKQDLGSILLGFSILMFGMQLMGDAVSPLKDMPEFSKILTMFNNPILGVAVGAIFTGIIQSSAASVGILQALSLTGSMTYGMAIPIVMGQNIGTCVTSLISSIGVNKNAKRVAVVHVSFNLIGTVVLLAAFYAVDLFMHFAFVDQAIGPVEIAMVHSIFNVATTLLLLPFPKQLEKLANLVVRDRKGTEKGETYELLDERLLRSPSLAISHCHDMTVKMGEMAQTQLLHSLALLRKYDAHMAQEILDKEDQIDRYEDKLGTYLVKLSSLELTGEDSHEISKLLHVIGDVERIGDHAVNIQRVALEMHDKKIGFSAQAKQELEVAVAALDEILQITMRAFCLDDLAAAKKVEPLEQVIDQLTNDIKTRHIHRLQNGLCTFEMGFILSDLLNDIERVSDHCSNIAVCLIQIHEEAFDTHEYLNEVKTSGQPAYLEEFDDFKKKYVLPL